MLMEPRLSRHSILLFAHLYSVLVLIEADEKCISAEQVAACDLKYLGGVVQSPKDAKKIWNAAKRSVKKRPAEGSPEEPAVKKSKKTKTQGGSAEESPAQTGAALDVPMSADTDEMSKTVVVTNRAPLVLAMAVTVTKYTMPEQPLSSRLSLGQAVVSANSRTRAGNLGLVTGPSAEEEGWGRGQPTVKVLGREISVLKRYGYSWKDVQGEETPQDEGSSVGKDKNDDAVAEDDENELALWGLDLEALRNTNKPTTQDFSRGQSSTSILPIYRPESAQQYLLKSFSFHRADHPHTTGESKKAAKQHSESQADKERCLGLLLGAIDEVCRSWASTLDRDELDRRAWSWYIRVRPEVQDGVSGWGQKGLVRLIDILDMKNEV